ncbi:hypothetical protein [Cupriavidus consociatus]|uniref:hypothetical protein n=1 Tax=Cupriavidus consociatus TaxID=2821357 RepID=UPI001AE2E80C|nr:MULTISPECIES: hypothetical protein [unclassified Cupriavidus]MBP0620463.1 hypothetical protein [Cupriavidus sp. LEh25]MDK2657120.1 hypothetical protein [Cupriavidus sp. LEh21]
MLAQVRAFFETHGASRFEYLASDQDQRIPNRAGFYRNGEAGQREFLVLSEAFRREVCQDFDPKTVVRALVSAGWLALDGGKPQRRERLPGLGRVRCYVFTSRMWEDES